MRAAAAFLAAFAAVGTARAIEARAVAVVNTGARWVAVGDRGAVALSPDGRAWRALPPVTDAPLTNVRFLDDRRGWAVGHDGVILATRDGGEHWRRVHPASAPLDQSLFDVLVSSRGLLAVGADGVALASPDGGETWTPRVVPSGGRHLYAAVESDGWWVAGEGGLVLYSVDGGLRWSRRDVPGGRTLFGLAAGPGGVVAYGFEGTAAVFRGGAWRPLKTGVDASFFAGFCDGDLLALAGAGGARVVSLDGGRSFQPLAGASVPWTSITALGPGRILFMGPEGSAVWEGAVPKTR